MEVEELLSKKTTQVGEVKLAKIEGSTFKPRSATDQGKIKQLTQSIKALGLIHPLLVRRKGDAFEVIVGGRRSQAAKKAGLESIPAVVKDVSDREALEMILAENLHREDMSAVDKGRVCKMLIEKSPDTYPNYKSLAEKMGFEPHTVWDWIELVERAPVGLQQLVAPAEVERRGVPQGKIDWTTAKRIVQRVKEPQRQVEIGKALAERHLPQRVMDKVLKRVAIEPQESIEKIIRKVEEAPPQLPFMSEHAYPILEGVKTQTSRKGIDPKIRPGLRVEAYTKFAELRVTEVSRKKLREFTDEDAKREGGYTLDEFKKVWKKLHGEWNPDESVYVVNFKLEKATLQPKP